MLLIVGCDDGGSKASGAPKTAAASAKKADGKDKAPAGKAAMPKPAEVKTADAKADTPAATPTPTPAEAPPPAAEPAVEPAADSAGEPEPDPAADPTALVEPAGDEDSGGPEDDPAAADDGAATADGAELNDIDAGNSTTLLRVVLAHDMENRQPVDPAVSFPLGQKVNLFIEARNEGTEEHSVRVTWEKVSNGRRSAPTTVRVPTRRKLHRTRAYRTIKRAGEYKAIVLGAGDEELAVLPFTVRES
ncbi:MAG: hypothetical protein AAF799_15395 [Myxococcota bacterium]